MEAVLALLFVAALTAVPLGVLAVRDRRYQAAEIIAADIRAAVRHRLRGESLLSVEVTPATRTRRGRVVLSTPSGYECLTERSGQPWPSVCLRATSWSCRGRAPRRRIGPTTRCHAPPERVPAHNAP